MTRLRMTPTDQVCDVLRARDRDVSVLALELIDWISKKGIEGHPATSVYGALHLLAGLTGQMSEHSFREALVQGVREADLVRNPPTPPQPVALREYVVEVIDEVCRKILIEATDPVHARSLATGRDYRVAEGFPEFVLDRRPYPLSPKTVVETKT